MTPTAAPPRRPPARFGVIPGLLIGCGLVAHGCHGADVDHEPAVPVPLRGDGPRNEDLTTGDTEITE